MATSELGFYQRFDESEIGDEDFVDTELCRVALNNLNHLADQRGQVLVNWNDCAEATLEYASPYEASPIDEAFYEVWRSTSFDLHVREDGTSYPCVVRLLVSSDDGTATSTFQAVLSWIGANAEAARARGGDDVSSAETVTSTTYSWVQADDPIYLDAEQVRLARLAAGSAPTINEPDGDVLGGVWVKACLVVFGATDDTANGEARLAGAWLAEFLPSS